MPEFRSRRRFRNNTSRILLLSRLSTYIFFGLIGLIIVTVITFIWFSRDLPTPGKLIQAQEAQSTRIFDRNGELLYSVYQDQNRVYVPLSDIPKDLQQATIAVEDKNFYTNPGFSPLSYLSVFKDLLLHGRIRGGSGLTQQLVRNTLISSERTLPRKIKELILAVQVDKKYSKDQVLEMYLNDVSYGGANVGVEAAAETYFGKHAKELDAAQSAFLAGLPQGPSLYSPFNGHKYYLDRLQEVLNQMTANGYMTQKQNESSLAEIKNIQFSDKNTSIKAPHFVIYMKQLLADQLHFTDAQIQNGGLQVTTTLDYKIQQKAEDIVKTEIDNLKNYNVGNGAAIIADPKTGEIFAMVGGKDYFGKSLPEGCSPGKNCVFEPNVNTAMVNRQPGSSLKPIMYATAFQRGYTPATLLMDTKTDFPTNDPAHPIYTPVNYDGKEHGPVQVRFALGNSLNIPAVKMLARIGIKDVMQQGYDMGIENWQPTKEHMADVGLSLVLGGRETTLLNEVTAYSVFANQGIRQDPVFIQKVTDSKGNVLYEAHKTPGQKVLSPEVSFLISHILLDNEARKMEFGPSSWLVVPGKTVSVKTGTTDEKRDNWTMGYTPSYVVGVWVGNDDNTVMNQAISSGITGASPIWNKIMNVVLKGKSNEEPQKPDTVTAVTIDAFGGGLPVDGQSTRAEFFIKGTEPTDPAGLYQKVKMSKHDHGKLASQWEVDHHDYDTADYIVFHEDDPVSTDGKNRWQDGINAWLQNNFKDDPKYHPPTDTSNYVGSDNNSNNNSNNTNNSNPTVTPSPTQTPMPTNTPTPTPLIKIP